MKHILNVAILLLTVALASCGAQKQVGIDTIPDKTTSISGKDIKSQTFASIEQCNTNWQDVKIPIKLKLKSPKDLSISGTLTMTRNRTIHISLRMLGFEVGALTLTEDSIVAYEKLNKHYLSESLTQMLSGFPATVGNLQALLLGKLFMPGNDKAALSAGKNTKIDVLKDGREAYILTPDIDINGLTCQFTVIPGNSPTLQSFSGTANSKPFRCDYSDFLTDNAAGKCATVLKLNVSAGENQIDGSIELNLKKAKWDTGETLSTKLPKGYQRISGSSLVKMLKQL